MIATNLCAVIFWNLLLRYDVREIVLYEQHSLWTCLSGFGIVYRTFSVRCCARDCVCRSWSLSCQIMQYIWRDAVEFAALTCQMFCHISRVSSIFGGRLINSYGRHSDISHIKKHLPGINLFLRLAPVATSHWQVRLKLLFKNMCCKLLVLKADHSLKHCWMCSDYLTASSKPRHQRLLLWLVSCLSTSVQFPALSVED